MTRSTEKLRVHLRNHFSGERVVKRRRRILRRLCSFSSPTIWRTRQHSESCCTSTAISSDCSLVGAAFFLDSMEVGFHRMETTHLATPGHAHILSNRDRGCGHSPSAAAACIWSFSPVPAVEFSGTAYAVSFPFLHSAHVRSRFLVRLLAGGMHISPCSSWRAAWRQYNYVH